MRARLRAVVDVDTRQDQRHDFRRIPALGRRQHLRTRRGIAVVKDSASCQRLLARLLRGRQSKFNVLPRRHVAWLAQ